jgi:hypothetical protein
MNRLIMFIAMMIVQASGLSWGGSYLLHLKNGNELRTSYYWEEGDEVKFYVYGGVAGLQKGFVSRITPLNANYKEDTSYKDNLEQSRTPLVPSDLKSKENRQPQIGDRVNQSNRNAEKREVVDFDAYRERKAALKEKLEDALERNREATARQDQEARESTRKEYLEFSKQIINLGDELKSKNKGVLPDWWEE